MLAASRFATLDSEDRPAPDAEPHEPHEWTDEEIETLLACSTARAVANVRRYDYAPFLTVAAKAGLRLGEGLGLDGPDLELIRGAGAINVRRQWTRLRELQPPKAGSRRRVPTSARQIADAIGHKKTSTTEIYIQRFNGEQADERIREAMSG